MSAPAAATPEGGPVVPEWTLGDRLRKIRRMTGDDQSEFADKLGANRKSYAAWELDYNSPRNLVAIAKRIEAMTGVPAAWVLGLDVPAATAVPTANVNRRYVRGSGDSRRGLRLVTRQGGTHSRSVIGRTREVTANAS